MTCGYSTRVLVRAIIPDKREETNPLKLVPTEEMNVLEMLNQTKRSDGPSTTSNYHHE